jgi:1-acyl-sn-glycerol-3-phosphate acyltransferase
MTAQYDPNAFTPGRGALQAWVSRHILRPWFRLTNRVTVHGSANIPANGPLVVVSNHLSLVDPPLLAATCGRPLAYIAKEELFANPLLAWLIKFCGAISVNRSRPQLSTFKVARQLLDSGWAVVMFIEGTRNKTPGVLGQPHHGPAFCALSSNALILPVGVVGTERQFGQAVIRIGPAFKPSENIDETTWVIMEALAELTGYALPERKTGATIRSWVPTRKPRA